MLTIYNNTALMLLALGVIAAIAPRGSAARARGAVSGRLLERLPLIATVNLSLVGAALVAIAFLHGEIRATPASEPDSPVPWDLILGSREFGLYVVYVGVAGMLYLGAALVMDSRPPHHSGKLWTAMTRWCARAAGWSALATVLLTPALLDLLLSSLRLRR